MVNGGPETVRGPAVDAIRQASADSTLAISAISVWEVAMLESKGRLQLNMDCLEWVNHAVRRAGIRVIPLSPEIAVASTRLPGGLHGDPSDRIIAATARHENAVLVTGDQALLTYASRGFLRAIEAV
jgi:PIN domain nuclease of toxin-antitoxin system